MKERRPMVARRHCGDIKWARINGLQRYMRNVGRIDILINLIVVIFSEVNIYIKTSNFTH